MLHRRADQSLIERAKQIRRGLTGTPLIPLADEQCDIVAKLEFCNPAGSTKDRSALWILEQAISRGEIAHDSAYWPNQYANPDARDAHYRFTAGELIAQAGPLDYLFVGVGTGGTIAGLSHRIKETYPGCVVVAVDAEGSVIFGGPPKKRRIPGIGSSIVPPLCGQALIDHVEIVSEVRAVEACADLVAKYGLYAGGSTGSTYAAVQDYFARHRPGAHRPRVAFIAADRGHAYAQTVYAPTWVQQLRAEAVEPARVEALAVK
jgi:cysteine synthase